MNSEYCPNCDCSGNDFSTIAYWAESDLNAFCDTASYPACVRCRLANTNPKDCCSVLRGTICCCVHHLQLGGEEEEEAYCELKNLLVIGEKRVLAQNSSCTKWLSVALVCCIVVLVSVIVSVLQKIDLL
jgi:hypothetical protein